MRILVTGHEGYIGRHVCRLLTASGHAVTGFDRTCGQSLHDRAAVLEAVTPPPDAVIHLAAECRAGESVTQPARYWRSNIVGTCDLLECLRAAGFRGRFVFASSCAAATPDASPYAASKHAGERLVTQACRAYGFSAVTLRLFNVAGGDDSTPGRIFVEAVRAARSGETLTVFAGQPTPDGTCVRDYVHVDDVCRAFLLALAAPVGGREVLVCDIGTGTATGVYGVVRAVERASGRVVRVREAAARVGDPARAVADVREAERLLGWRAGLGIDDMARDAWGAVT